MNQPSKPVNSIDALAFQAKTIQKTTPRLKPAVFAIQNTEERNKVKALHSKATLPFPVIEKEAFGQRYMDKLHKMMLPVFCFFAVDETPEFSSQLYHQGRGEYGVMHTNRMGIPLTSTELEAKIPIPKQSVQLRFFTLFILVELFVLIVFNIYHPMFDVTNSREEVLTCLLIAAELVVCGIITAAYFFVPRIDGGQREVHKVEAKTRLQHIIPDDVVELIKKHSDNRTFNRGLYIVADVQNQWEVNTVTKMEPMDLDPLLVGVHDVEGVETYYLVHKFDLTPAEAYIGSAEFVTKA